MDAFASVIAGTLSPVDFFDPANIQQMLRTRGQLSRRSLEDDHRDHVRHVRGSDQRRGPAGLRRPGGRPLGRAFLLAGR